MIYAIFTLNFTLTVLIEGALIALLFRKWRYVYASFLCNMLTNPAMNLLMLILVNCLGSEYYGIIVAVLEVIVVIVETFVFKLLCDFRVKKAMVVSVFVNAVSYGVGFAAYALLISLT